MQLPPHGYHELPGPALSVLYLVRNPPSGNLHARVTTEGKRHGFNEEITAALTQDQCYS